MSRHRVEFVTVDSEPAAGVAGDQTELVLEARRPTDDDDAGWRYTTTPVTAPTVQDHHVCYATTLVEPHDHPAGVTRPPR